ncbi:MAG: GNAT family N-acetyltransferase [Pikeienuella sp.]
MGGVFCRLEPLLLDHAPGLHAAYAADVSGSIWTYLPYGPFADLEAYRPWVAGAARPADPLFFAVLVDDRPLGVASYLRIAPQAGSIEIGHICFAPSLQRTPAATEALTIMIRWAFEAGYRRVEWKCNAANAASCRAAERLGFAYEGVFRQAGVVKGRNRDTAWFAAIDRDWPALATAYAQWLAPANFTPSGEQRLRLSELTRPVRPDGS